MRPKGYYVYVDFRKGGVPFYVGKGKGPRFTMPLRRENSRWMGVVKKEKSYTRHLIKSNLSEQDAFDLEMELIKKYKGTLVNHTDGGDGASGYKHTKEIKLLLSRLAKGRKHTDATKLKMSLAHKGIKFGPMSKESKLKLSMAQRGNKYCVGRVLSEETKRKISVSLTGRKRTW